jgi:hypothetical protein
MLALLHCLAARGTMAGIVIAEYGPIALSAIGLIHTRRYAAASS